MGNLKIRELLTSNQTKRIQMLNCYLNKGVLYELAVFTT